MNLSRMRTSELYRLLEDANLTEDEEEIYWMLAKGKSRLQISDQMNTSTATVDRRIRSMRRKLNM